MSAHSVRASHAHIPGLKPVSFDFVKASVWFAAAVAPWVALFLIGRHIF